MKRSLFRRNIIAVTLILLLILIEGCSSRLFRKPPPVFQPDSESLYAYFHHFYGGVKRLDSECKISIQYGIIRATVRGEFKFAGRDSLHGVITGPFKTELARFSIIGDQFSILVRKREFYSGNVDTINWSEKTGFPIPDVNPIALFFPIPDYALFQSKNGELTELGDKLIWRVQPEDSDSEQLLVIIPGDRSIQQEEFLSQDADLVRKTYLYGTTGRGTPLPEQMEVELPEMTTPLYIGIEYTHYKINPRWKTDSFQITQTADL